MTAQEYQAKVRNVAIPAVYLILECWKGWGSDRKILMCLRKNTGYMDGMWDLPAGHVEAGELPTKAVMREAREEIGVRILRRHLKLVHISYLPKHDKTGDRVSFVFYANAYRGVPTVCEPEKCERIEWFKPSRVTGRLPVIPHIREFIRLWKKMGANFSELDVKWLKTHGEYKL